MIVPRRRLVNTCHCGIIRRPGIFLRSRLYQGPGCHFFRGRGRAAPGNEKCRAWRRAAMVKSWLRLPIYLWDPPSVGGICTGKAPGRRRALAHHQRGVLVEFIHELSSPLSLVCTEHTPQVINEPSLRAGAERLRQLFDYASATLVAKWLPLAEANFRWPVLRARERLRRSSVSIGEVRARLSAGARAVVPAEPLWAEVLFAGWLEAACYGAPEAPMEIRARECSGQVLVLTAECAAQVRRNREMVRRRLAVRAANHLAKLCGGRMIVYASKPKAVLTLPMTSKAAGTGVKTS